MLHVLGCCHTQALDESRAVQDTAAPKGPCSACQGDRYSGTEEPGTLLPCLALPNLSTPQTAGETTSLCISASLLGICLASVRGLLSRASGRQLIIFISLFQSTISALRGLHYTLGCSCMRLVDPGSPSLPFCKLKKPH